MEFGLRCALVFLHAVIYTYKRVWFVIPTLILSEVWGLIQLNFHSTNSVDVRRIHEFCRTTTHYNKL